MTDTFTTDELAELIISMRPDIPAISVPDRVAWIHGAANTIAGLYQKVLHRRVDMSGFVTYMEAASTGLTGEQLEAILVASVKPDPVPDPVPVAVVPVEPFADFLTQPDDTQTPFAFAAVSGRAKALAAHKAQNYTRYCVDCCTSLGKNAFTDSAPYKQACVEIIATGLGPWLFLAPTEPDVQGLYKGNPAKLAQGIKDFGKALDSTLTVAHDVCAGVEVNTTIPDMAGQLLLVKAMRDGFPRANRWMHYDSGVWGPVGHEMEFWKAAKAAGITGIAYQYPKVKPGPSGSGFTVSDAVMKSETSRLIKALGPLGLKVVVGEYSYGQVESDSMRLGDLGLGRGAFGAINGSSGYHPPAPLNPGVDGIPIAQITFLNRGKVDAAYDKRVKALPIIDTITPNFKGQHMEFHNQVVGGEVHNIWQDKKDQQWYGQRFDWGGLRAAPSWDGMGSEYNDPLDSHHLTSNHDPTVSGSEVYVMACIPTDGSVVPGMPLGRSNIALIKNAKKPAGR